MSGLPWLPNEHCYISPSTAVSSPVWPASNTCSYRRQNIRNDRRYVYDVADRRRGIPSRGEFAPFVVLPVSNRSRAPVRADGRIRLRRKSEYDVARGESFQRIHAVIRGTAASTFCDGPRGVSYQYDGFRSRVCMLGGSELLTRPRHGDVDGRITGFREAAGLCRFGYTNSATPVVMAGCAVSTDSRTHSHRRATDRSLDARPCVCRSNESARQGRWSSVNARLRLRQTIVAAARRSTTPNRMSLRQASGKAPSTTTTMDGTESDLRGA